MGMPNITISFTEVANETIIRSERGVVALILKDEKGAKLETNPLHIYDAADIDATLEEDTKKQIRLALMGYENAPKKVVAYFISDEAEEATFEDALEYFEVNRFDYLAMPSIVEDEKQTEIVEWIKARREEGKKRKAVLPNVAADCEGIINFTNTQVTNADGDVFTTAEYCARIAGLLAGTPLTLSATYATLPELVACNKMTKKEMDAAIEAGKFFVFNDSEKIKVARGVNSMTTTTKTKGQQFKKIKIVEAMDVIDEAIRTTAEDTYLGKYTNSYDNKCLLVSAISNYFRELISAGILMDAQIGIDLAAQRAYLKEIGTDVSELSDDEIKAANTRDKVFLTAKVEILDAIEEITLPISI